MLRFSLLSVFIVLFVSCKKDNNIIEDPTQLIPSNINSVVVIKERNDFIRSSKNHKILNGIYNKESKHVSTLLKNLNSSKPIYMAFLNQDDADYLLITENDSTLFKIDSIPSHTAERMTKINIDKIQIDSSEFFTKIKGGYFCASNSLDIIKNLELNQERSEFNELLTTLDNKSITSTVFQDLKSPYHKLFFDKNNLLEGQVSSIDIDHTEDNLIFNGVTSSKDTTRTILNCFSKTVPQKINAVAIAPSETASLVSLTYNDFSIFNTNIQTYRNVDIDSSNNFMNFTNEISRSDNALILHSLDTDLILETIEDKTIKESFREIDIYKFGRPDMFETIVAPFFSYHNAEYFFIYKDFVVFSENVASLKSIIASALNNNTLSNSDAFINIQDNLSDEASLFIFKNSKGLSEALNRNLTGYDANVVQYIYEEDYAHINGVIQKFKRKAVANSINEFFTISLDAQLLSSPQTVKNHITKAYDIAAQDVDNNLYLISSSGSVLWKKQLQGEILGKIEQIDMYKNGRLQLAFATPNRIYVLDRNGNDVTPFPLKFNDDITQPLSVFDYDKNRNFRLLVTQGKSLLMYDGKGKRINGFNYNTNGFAISSQPKHFRIGSKDYIAFKTGDYLKILNRQGKVRININERLRFSDNELFLYQNKFTSTSSLGELIQVDTKGTIQTKNLNLPENHILETTSKTMVTMTDNILNIKSRRLDLDYGNYSDPKIFYLNDKIYVTITDLDSKKVYLFDSQAKPISNFPIFGTSAAHLQNLDKASGLELITQVDDKSFLVYKLN